ncbi:MAG: tetratricopeptide repeat protein [Cyclobacteriaceae bacterium]
MSALAFLISLFTLLPIQQSPAEKYLDAGYEKYSDEDYKGAILDYNKAASFDQLNPEVYYLRGVCYSTMGETVKAMKDLQMATELNPEYAEAYYEIGYIFLTDQNAAEAIKAFDKAIQFDPEFAEALVSRGTAKCMMEDKEGANADWLKAKELGIAYSDYMVCD